MNKPGVNKAPLDSLIRAMQAGRSGGRGGTRSSSDLGGGPFGQLRTAWARIYSAFARKEFIANSRGGRNWESLKPQTIKRRRHGKGKAKGTSILWDTGTLLGALTIGARGNLTTPISDGVRFGIAGPDSHGGGMTIARLAEIHNSGAPRANIPGRPIIIEPSPETTNRLLIALKRFVEQAAGGIAR